MPPDRSLKPALLSALAVTVVTVLVLGGGNSVQAVATLLLDGWLPLLNLVAATLGGLALIRRLVPTAGRAWLVASGAGLGLGVLLTAGLLLGLAGALNGPTAWACVLLLLGGGAVDVYIDRDRWNRPVRLGPAAWLLVLPAFPLGIALLAATMPPGSMWGGEPNGYDVVSYHLQIPREWYAAGRIVPLEHNVFSYFPLGNETLFLLLMHQHGGPDAPWTAMYAAQLLNVGVVALAALGVYGAVREVRDAAPRPPSASDDDPAAPAPAPASALPALVAAVLFACVPWTTMLASIAYNEPLMLLGTALCAGWLVQSVLRETHPSAWRAALLAGLFAGLAVTAKYPAVPMVGIVGGVALATALLLPLLGTPDPRRLAVVLLAFIVGACVLSMPWLLRNWVWIGNPVFPLGTGLFGDGGWDAALLERWQRAHAPAAGASRLGRLWAEVLFSARYAWVLWPLVIAAAVVVAGRRSRAGGFLILWLAGMGIVWLTFTHLQGRFLVIALPPAVLVLGLAARWRPMRWIMPGLTVAVSVVGIAVTLLTLWPRIEPSRSGEAALFGIGVLAYGTPFERFDPVAGREVYLVGDARAFLYQVKSLHYRVVFNVPPAGGALEGWLGEALQAAPPDALVVIDPGEIKRLSRTYRTPGLEVDLPSGPGGAVVLTMGQVRQLLAAASPQ